MLDLRQPNTDAYRQLVGPGLGTNELEGGFHSDAVCTSVHMVEAASKNDCHQCLYPQDELHLPVASLGDSPRLAGRSGPGSYQMTAFALGPRACEILCVPFKSEVSIFPSPVGLPKLSPVGWGA